MTRKAWFVGVACGAVVSLCFFTLWTQSQQFNQALLGLSRSQLTTQPPSPDRGTQQRATRIVRPRTETPPPSSPDRGSQQRASKVVGPRTETPPPSSPDRGSQQRATKVVRPRTDRGSKQQTTTPSKENPIFEAQKRVLDSPRATLRGSSSVASDQHGGGKARGAANETFLIYSCSGRHGLCGGWADRQNGIVSAFLLALAAKRRFGVTMTFPCDIRHFYQPNEYDWIVRDQDIANKTQKMYKSIDHGSQMYKRMSRMDFNAHCPEEVVILQSNNQMLKQISLNPLYNASLPLWAQPRPHSPIRYFHDVWHMLMKPSARLERRLSSLLTQLSYLRRTRPLVCVHVRIGNSATIRDSEHRNDVDKLGPVWDFVADYVRNGSRFFLATDNLEVRNMSRQKFGSAHSDAGGLITHVDRKNNETYACLGFEDALVEQLMLSRCDVLLLTHSGFGKNAVRMKGSSRNTFMFKNGKISPHDEV